MPLYPLLHNNQQWCQYGYLEGFPHLERLAVTFSRSSGERAYPLLGGNIVESIVDDGVEANSHLPLRPHRLAPCAGRTLKAYDDSIGSEARITSLSDICPTALCITFTFISSLESFTIESDRASTEPSISPLTIILSSLHFALDIRRLMSINDGQRCVHSLLTL